MTTLKQGLTGLSLLVHNQTMKRHGIHTTVAGATLWTILVAALLIGSHILQAAANQEPSLESDPLTAGFLNPPATAKPSAYYLMLNGYLNRDHVERELAALAEKGIGGLCIFDMGGRGAPETLPPPGPPFMSDAWLDQFAHLLRMAGNLGMTAQLSVSSSWDMGASWVRPEDASMALYHSALPVRISTDQARMDRVELKLPLPDIPESAPRNENGDLLFLREVALLALPAPEDGDSDENRIILDPKNIVHLQEPIAEDGRWQGNLPAGRWVLLRFVCANTGERLKVPSPNSNGLATDHFSADVTRRYIAQLTSRLQARLGDLRRTALKQLYLPSYEVRGRLWTPGLLGKFQHYRGYDMTKYLPALAGHVIQSKEHTDSFLYDFQKTMGELLVDAYYRAASQTAREAGLGVEAEAGGPGPPVHQVPVNALQALGAIDEMRGEFWPWRLDNDPLWVVKETACAAHVYGRRRVHMEAFTGFYHWESGPYDLKFSADRAFGEGMNHVVWHTSSHQPPEAGLPGWVYGAGTHLTPNLIWWPMAKPFMDYLARASFLLQQGLFVADVCHYYGDQGSNFVPPKHIHPSFGEGYDYDVANPEVILERMRVENGRITLPDGMSYALLTLPDREDMSVAVLRKVTALVEQGATVAGRKPIRAAGLFNRSERDREIRELADLLWGECDGERILENRHGKGRIVCGKSWREILQEQGVNPDFQYAGDDGEARLDYVHRRTPDAEIYFVRNVEKEPVSVSAEFRVAGKVPELWSPVTGKIKRQAVYRNTAHGIRLPLRLPPWGSVFVVFRERATTPAIATADSSLEMEQIDEETLRAASHANGVFNLTLADGSKRQLAFEGIPGALTLAEPWQVRFESPLGHEITITMHELASWTEHGEEMIRHFSGTASYTTEFELPASWTSPGIRVLLDLGNLWTAGKVSVNGRDHGILWCPPFQVEITAAIREGRNRLEIAVANTWANRLIGDALLPDNERRTRTNITRSGDGRKAWKDKRLLESGLLGPVRLIPGRTQTIALPWTMD